MAELDSLTAALYGTATSQSWTYWLNLGISVILGTLIGGLVLVGVVSAARKAFGEDVRVANAFLLVLIVNIITILGVIGFLSAAVPAAALVVPLLIWIGLTKAFFSAMAWKHVIIIAVIGYVLNILIIPPLVSYAASFIQLPK